MTCVYVYLAETGINRFKLSWKSAFAFHPLTKLYIAEKYCRRFVFARRNLLRWSRDVYEEERKEE